MLADGGGLHALRGRLSIHKIEGLNLKQHRNRKQKQGGSRDDAKQNNIDQNLESVRVFIRFKKRQDLSKWMSHRLLDCLLRNPNIQVIEAHKHHKNQEGPHGHNQHHECVVVVVPDAVVDPRAVVVETVDAAVAVVAVVGFAGPNDFTPWADVSWLEVLVQFHKRDGL